MLPRLPHPLFSLLVCFLPLRGVFGNTEIINFSAVNDQALEFPFTSSWPILAPNTPFLIRNISSAPLETKLPQEICVLLDKWNSDDSTTTSSCCHELWIVLDLDQEEWKGFNKFTLRVSWPAYHPTDFDLKIFDPIDLAPFSKISAAGISSTTRRKYARIQAVHSGVLTPGVQLDDASRYTVPVHVILEPLHLGVLPASVIPVVIAILGVIAVGLPVSRKVNDCLQAIAKDANEEGKRARKSD
ncbi:hypothetical protein NLJ89_g6773 [Agrocybe chaxingu]|uniref:Uncharacterized protein n=1 Tax=Agrocybe chaxingu TaxID=84603 RepID=A0A9W8MSC7_9AGAR|nr:hypothetical protein NLJ89_g6773 [Agrocybe chaxingu]